MKRLYFSVINAPALQRALTVVELDAHWRFVAPASRHSRLRHVPYASLFSTSRIVPQTLRGGFWGAVVALVVTMVVMEIGQLTGVAKTIVIFSLPLALVFFGAWLGGLLGLMQLDSTLQKHLGDCQEGEILLYVDASVFAERLAKRTMAKHGAPLLAEEYKGWRLSWLFPSFVAEEMHRDV